MKQSQFKQALTQVATNIELCEQDIHYIVQSIDNIRQELLKEHNFKISHCEIVPDGNKPINIALWYEDSFQNKGGPESKKEKYSYGRYYVGLSDIIEKYFNRTISEGTTIFSDLLNIYLDNIQIKNECIFSGDLFGDTYDNINQKQFQQIKELFDLIKEKMNVNEIFIKPERYNINFVNFDLCGTNKYNGDKVFITLAVITEMNDEQRKFSIQKSDIENREHWTHDYYGVEIILYDSADFVLFTNYILNYFDLLDKVKLEYSYQDGWYYHDYFQMHYKKRGVNIGEKYGEELSDEYEGVDMSFLVKVDVINAFSVNMHLENDMSIAKNKVCNLIKYFKELHSEIEFEYDKCGFRWYSSQYKEKFGEICISIEIIGEFNRKYDTYLTELCELPLFPNAKHNELLDLPKECPKETPYPKITKYLAHKSKKPLAKTTLQHTNVSRSAAYEYAKRLMVKNNEFVRLSQIVKSSFDDKTTYTDEWFY